MFSDLRRENQVVVVSGGVIQSVSDVTATPLPAHLLQINGEGRYLMPGLAEVVLYRGDKDCAHELYRKALVLTP